MPQKDKRKVSSDDDDKVASKKLKSSNNMFFSSFYRRRSKDSSDTSSSNFNPKKCLALFNEYASKEDRTIIDPQGIQLLCSHIQVHIEDPVLLALAWKMDSKQMGVFTQKEWLKGLSELQCDSINKLKSKIDYLRQLLLDPVSFKCIYRYTFGFSKEPNQKFLDINTAKALLKILLADINKWTLFDYFIEFLNHSNYNYINSDQWCNILEFSKTVSPDLKNYAGEDSAWPIMIDEFCSWYKSNVLNPKQQQI